MITIALLSFRIQRAFEGGKESQRQLLALRFGERQLAAAFSVDAGPRQLAGGLDYALQTAGHWAVHS
jgi:hypothetical protein